ncbi:MAG: hypothetical protein DRP85_03045 [Candidatus Makaraimicrobium thalassicum]|nr:MAG: hypothetical protein DRP85_03045 [Candidatus Omnitrophota bacterium]
MVMTAFFIIALLVMGVTYLNLCRRISECLLKTITFRGKIEEEGGDNWLKIQPDIEGFDNCDDLTYKDFEGNDAEVRSVKKEELCGHLN